MKVFGKKHELTVEQKKLETNLWIIAIVSMLAYGAYAAIGKNLTAFFKDSSISVWAASLNFSSNGIWSSRTWNHISLSDS